MIRNNLVLMLEIQLRKGFETFLFVKKGDNKGLKRLFLCWESRIE